MDATAVARRARRLWVVAAAMPLVVGLVVTIRSAWVCDDAFISFRYADNLVGGLGLVYNAGERVEGYTHFLWVILLAATQRVGVDLVEAGRYLPVVFHAGTLALLFLWSLRQSRAWGLFLPVAAWALALHRDAQIWASGGLETAAFTLFVTACILAGAGARPRPGAVATLAALATMFRPEGVLVTACAAGVLAWRHRSRGVLARFAGVWLMLVAPLVAWRLVYYHDWLPNTFYAKSAARANWEQGWRYAVSYFTAYPVLLLALATGATAGMQPARRAGDATIPSVVTCIVLLLYVVRVGGDFMYARFLVPVTPLLFVALESTIRWLQRPGLCIAAAAFVALGATLLTPAARSRTLANHARVPGIADEHAIYTREFVDDRRREGATMAAIFHDTGIRVCTLGSQAGFAYFSRFPYVFERYGLTDREFARRRIAERGRPGHERGLSRADLVARRVHLVFRGAGEYRQELADEAVFGGLLASVVFYDRPVMDVLRGRPGVQFVDYPAFLDSMVPAAGGLSPEVRRQAWATAEGYYFDHNEDPEREARVRAALWVAP